MIKLRRFDVDVHGIVRLGGFTSYIVGSCPPPGASLERFRQQVKWELVALLSRDERAGDFPVAGWCKKYIP